MPKIVKAKIQMQKSWGIDLPTVLADFEDGRTDVRLFQYYPDELFFSPEEFVGLTEEQAHGLFLKKDTAYLRS